MARLKHTTTGVVVNVRDDKAARMAGRDWQPEGAATTASDDGGYSSMKVDELRAAIASRNEGRDEADLIPSDGKKADLIAALEADDASSSPGE